MRIEEQPLMDIGTGNENENGIRKDIDMSSNFIGCCDSCGHPVMVGERHYYIRFPYDQYLLCDKCVTHIEPLESESATGTEKENEQ